LVAIDDDLVVRVQLLGPQLDLLDRDVHGVLEPAELGLPVLAHVEQQRPVVALETSLQLVRGDLAHGRPSPWGAPVWPPPPPGPRSDAPRRSRGAPRTAGRSSAIFKNPDGHQRGAGRPTRKSASQPFTTCACSMCGKWPHASSQRTLPRAKPSAVSAQCAAGMAGSWRPWTKRTGTSRVAMARR